MILLGLVCSEIFSQIQILSDWIWFGGRSHHLKSNLVNIVLGYGVVLYLLDVPIRHEHNFDVSTNTVYLTTPMFSG